MKTPFTFKSFDSYTKHLASVIANAHVIDRSQVITVSIGRKKVDMTIAEYILNLVLSKADFHYGNTKYNLYSHKNITANNINDHVNRYVWEKYMFKVEDVKMLKKLMINIIEDLILISAKTNTYSGNTINIYDIIKEASTNKKLYDIMTTKLDIGTGVLEGEKILNDLTDDYKELLLGFDNSLKVYLESNVGIKDKQLRETFINMGYVSTIEGNILPKPINISLLNGMDGPIDYYISAIGARKALVTNYNLVGKSGHFTRKSLLLLTDMDFHLEDDCGSEMYVPIEITNQRRLSSLHGKYYKLRNGVLKRINKADTKLIKRIVHVRSPITCKFAHENKVCKKCFGDLWKTSEDLHIGIMSVLFLTSNFTQSLLSTKHLSKITIESVMWDEATKMYFDISKSSIVPKISNIEIIIDDNDIEEGRAGQGRIQTLTIVDGESEIVVDFPVPVYNDDIIDIIKKNKRVTLSGKDINKLKFKYIIENTEFFKILDKTLLLLDNNKIKERDSYHEVLHDFTNILDESGVHLNSSFSELFISNLIRDLEDPYKKHDFHNGKEYGMVRMSMAIQYSSQLMGVSFEKIKTQFLNVSFYNNENISPIENFYK